MSIVSPAVTVEELKLAVINIIEARSGKKLTLEEYEKLDYVTIMELLKITRISVTIIRRLHYGIVDLARRKNLRAKLKI